MTSYQSFAADTTYQAISPVQTAKTLDIDPKYQIPYEEITFGTQLGKGLSGFELHSG